MAGLFGTAQGVQGALGSLFNSGGVSLPTGGGKLSPERSGGRGGLFGRRIDPAQIQQMLAMAQAAMAGDYAAMGTMSAQMQRNRLLQQQAQAEAEEAEAQYLSAHQALAGQGLDKHQIYAMRPEDRSGLLREQLQPRQFGAEGGSVLNPVTGQFTRAPWQRTVGREVVDGGPNGEPPRIIHQGVEPIAVPDGGAMYGMTGDGRIMQPGETLPRNGIPGQPAQPAPQQGSAPGAPPVGTVQGGFRFRGGNHRDPSNWERVEGGQQSPTAGNFPDPIRYPPGQW